MRVAILGGGITGLSIARMVPFHLVGGRCFNSQNPEVLEFVFTAMAADSCKKIKRNAKNEFSVKPIFAFDPERAQHITVGVLSKTDNGSTNLADWFRGKFGNTLASTIPLNVLPKIVQNNPAKTLDFVSMSKWNSISNCLWETAPIDETWTYYPDPWVQSFDLYVKSPWSKIIMCPTYIHKYSYRKLRTLFFEAVGCKISIMALDRNSFPELSGYGKHGFEIKGTNPTVEGDDLLAAFKSRISGKWVTRRRPAALKSIPGKRSRAKL